VNSSHLTIREGSCIKAPCVLSVLVKPEANCVLWFHIVWSPYWCCVLGLEPTR